MNKKWNISLLVLFVLVACSLLGIIAVQYTKHMAIQTNQVYNYYKTYYLAKWGSEIGLSLMQLRWIWYSLDIEENSDFVKQNISTWNTFSLNIQWNWSIISNWYPGDETCSNPIKIYSWQSFILPLFIDTPINIETLQEKSLTEHFSEQKFYTNKSEFLKSIKIINSEPRNVNIWIIISSWWHLNELGIFFTDWIFQWDDFFEEFNEKIKEAFEKTSDYETINWTNLQNLQNYVIIANKDSQELSFCLELPEWNTLALTKTYISSFWSTNTKKMWLETIYQQPTPSYLIDSSIQTIE